MTDTIHPGRTFATTRAYGRGRTYGQPRTIRTYGVSRSYAELSGVTDQPREPRRRATAVALAER